MDFATLIGIVGGLGIIMYSMVLGGGLAPFWDLPSFLIVLGASIFVVMIKCGLGQFFKSFGNGFKALISVHYDHYAFIEEVAKIADAVRKGGLLSLEGMAMSDPFMKKGVLLLIDGHDPETVKNIMLKDMNLTLERHAASQKMFRSFGDVLPAMGMIGTLIGLVLMLGSMEDPNTIGPSMAVALLTTLYGAILANMVAIPIADKLEYRSEQERIAKSLVIDAVMGIQAGQNPHLIQEHLKNYLPNNKRNSEASAA